MSKKDRNPLSIFIGMFIQSERKRLGGLSIEEMSTNIGISTSLYKMIEAGHATINIGDIREWIRVFKWNDYPFDRFLKYISAQAFLQHLIKDLEDKAAFAELAKHDAEFKALYEKTEKYFDDKQGVSDQKEYINKVVLPEIHSFLANRVYPSSKTEHFENAVLLDKIKKMPSLNLDILADFTDRMVSIAPMHFGHIAAKWEQDNWDRFTDIYGYYTDPRFIISPKNLSEFGYEYLNGREFQSCNIIFKTDNDDSYLKDEMCKTLNKRSNKPKISLATSESRINIRSIAKENEDLRNLLRDPENPQNMLQAFWVFTTISGNKIAFVGLENHPNTNIVYNLSYEETLRRDSIIRKIWSSLTHLDKK